MTTPERPAGRSSQADALALFAVLWALAGLWHLLGNAGAAPAWAQFLLVIGIALVLVRPGAAIPLAVLASAGLVTMWEEAPLLGNHWLLAGFVDLAILMAIATGALRRRFGERADLARRLFPAARLCLIGFYAFAAFAKLNSSFFDRSVSCAVFYFRESTRSVGLTPLQLHGAAWLEEAVIVGTVVVELAIPILLVTRRTRAAGVVIGLAFHALLALDRTHQFFDFSSTLYPLFVLFLPPMAGTWVAERVGSIRARLALRGERLPQRVHLALAAAPVLIGLLVVAGLLVPRTFTDIGWWAWQLGAIVVGIVTIAFLRQHPSPAAGYLHPHHAVFAVIPVLVVLNGVTPYIELKTGYGWNMYANLRTVDGDSNHLIVRRTIPVTHEQDDLVEIVSSSSEALQTYAKDDFALTFVQLRSYLVRHPAVRITYRRGGELVSLRRASDRPELVAPVPTWREKALLFRAVDMHDPTRCSASFGPAR